MDHLNSRVNLTAEEILKRRLADGFWGLGERTPNRRYLQKGDQIVFHLGSPVMAFAASATLASESFALSDEHKAKYWHSKLHEAEYGVLLDNVLGYDRNEGTIGEVKNSDGKSLSPEIVKAGLVAC